MTRFTVLAEEATMQLTPPDPPLTRGRVLIRPPGKGDLDAITAMCQDPDSARFTRVPADYTMADAEEWLALSRTGWREGTHANFIGIDLHTGNFLGSCGLQLDARENAAEVGYMIAPGERGRGLATWLAAMVCSFGFDDLGLGRLTLIASATNEGSLRVAKRLGFTVEGTLRLAHIDGPTGDAQAPRVDAVIHGLLPGELRDPEETLDD